MGHTSHNVIRAALFAISCTAALSTSTVFALQGGDPADPNSCYSDCGDSAIIPGVQNCFCDALCETKGDCCADKHEWCAPSTATPICSLVDAIKKPTSQTSQICGSDLGFSFVHNGRLEILFGDTAEYDNIANTTCVDHGVDGRPPANPPDYNDDMQARFGGSTVRPGWVPTLASGVTTGFERKCSDISAGASVLDFDKKPTSGVNFTFQQLRLKKASGMDLPLGLLNTPLAAFSDGVSAWALFAAPADDNPFSELLKHVYVARRHGEATIADRTRYNVVADLGLAEGMGSPSDPHTKFTNASAARATSLTNFDTPSGPADSEIFIWGRPRFESGDADDPATNPMFLMRQHVPVTGISTFTPVYFNGADSSGQATWTPTAPGVPVLVSDFRAVRQIDIKWIKELKKWVMLYGGDSPDWGTATPTIMDQPRHGAIHMRTADFPWGPWSRPTPLLWREQMGRYYQCDAYSTTTPQGCDRFTWPPPSYPTSDWERNAFTNFSGTSPYQDAPCQTSHPKPAASPNLNPISPFCPWLSQRGNLYAANLLPTWTRHTDGGAGGNSSTTLYFVVSTWYPYNVVLGAADLITPRVSYPLQMQLRQVASNKLIAGSGSAPTFTTTAGGPNGGLAAFRIELAVPADRKMKIGDVVVLRHVNDSNRLLSVSGSTLAYITNTASPATTARWRLTSPVHPVGRLVTPGSTQFRLNPVSNASAFLKSAGSPSQPSLGPADGNALWRFSYHCQSGDTCAR
jgi:hypothetical protein